MITFAFVKKRRTYIIYLMTLLIPALLITGCYEDDSCNQNTETGINITVSNSGSDASTDLDGLNQNSIESWRVTAVGDTTALVDSESDYNTGIPLDMNDTTVTLLFKIRDNDTTDYLVDTVIFTYIQTDLQLLTVTCGFAPVFNITGGEFYMNTLDSVIIYEQEVSTDLQTNNVTFYY